MTLFLYHELRKPYKQLNQLCGLPHLIWLKGIYNWQWMKLTSIKQHSVQARLVYMSLLACHLVCLMWELVFVISWRCVLEINSISRSCSISTTSVSSAALLTRCWTGSGWYWDIFKTLISKLSQRRVFSFNLKYFSGPYIIKWRDFTKSRKSSKGKGLASSIQCKGSSFIFGVSILLSLVHTAICKVG